MALRRLGRLLCVPLRGQPLGDLLLPAEGLDVRSAVGVPQCGLVRTDIVNNISGVLCDQSVHLLRAKLDGQT
jgi:hypothetical protein